MEKGPTGKERSVYGLYKISGDGADCVEAITKAKSQDPSLPDIEKSAEPYADVLLKIVKQINELYTYYDQKDYKDDNFQKGKEMHSKFVETYKEFDKANKVFTVEIDKLEDEVAQTQLEKFKDNPNKNYEYLVVLSGIDSKKIKNLVQNKKYTEITADELKPLIEKFETTTKELKEASSDKKASSIYINSCNDFLKASKEMMRRIRDKKTFSDIEKRQIGLNAGWMVSGSPDKVIKAYNSMIGNRSFTRF